MVVNENNKVAINANGKVIINDPINEFLGTVSNLYQNPANWSLGVIPTANQIAIINADCINTGFINVAVRQLHLNAGFTLTNDGAYITVSEKLDNRGNIINNASFSLAGVFANSYIGNITSNGVIFQFAFVDEYDFPSTIILSAGEFRFTQGKVNFKHSITFPARLYLPGAGTPAVAMNLADNTEVSVLGSLDFDSSLPNKIQLGINSKLIGLGATQFNASNIISTTGSEIISRGTSFRLNTSNLNLLIPAQVVLETVNKQLIMNSNSIMTVEQFQINNIVIDYVYVNTANSGAVSVINIVGLSSLSVWNNKCLLRVKNSGDFMPIGIFNAFFDNSKVSYDLGGNQTIRIPNDTGYKELRLETNGVKSLIGHTTCDHLYFSGTATLDLNGFTLTGYTKCTDIRAISTVLPNLTGVTELTVGGGAVNQRTLSSNASLDNMYQVSNSTIVLSGFTITAINFYNTSVQNNGSLSPDVVTATNWFYNINQAQWVGAGSYNNLTLGGGGIKTLQGNVVVTGTYLRTGTATVNLNGFTLKDGGGNNITP